MFGLIWRGLGAALFCFVVLGGANAQESAGEYWAKERAAALHPATGSFKRVRLPRPDGLIVPAATSSTVVAQAMRLVGRSGPSLGLPSSLWCADFANLVLSRSGKATVPTRLAAGMVRAGPRIARARVGALAITGRKRGGHVSIVAAVYPDGSFLAINGNGSGRRVTLSVRGPRAVFVMPRAP